jgi:HEAT repeat protein
MILLACSTVIHAESSVEQELDALVAAMNLNGLVQVFEEAIGKGLDDKRAQSCTTIMSYMESQTLPNTFKAELLTLIVRFGGAESVEALTNLLHHENLMFKTRAVLGLQQNPSDSAAVVLRKALAEASTPEHQAVFIHALIKRGDAASLPRFIQLAKSKDTPVRNLALRGVALMSDKPLNALFQAGIKQDSKAAKMDAVNAYLAHADRLAEVGKKKEALSIYRELVTLDGYQKGSALLGLAIVGGMEELDTILEGMKGESRQNLAILNRLLFSNPDEQQDITKLYERIRVANPDLKASLLTVLGIYADPASLDTVLTAAGDTHDLVRRAALSALGHFDHERATDALIAAVVSGEDRSIAVQALENSPGKSKMAETLKKALPACSGPARVSLVRLLSNCPKAECVPVFLEALKDTDPQVRAEALDGLAKAGAPSTFGPVVAHLAGEPDPNVRYKAMAALSALVDISGASPERSSIVLVELMNSDGPGRVELISILPKVSSAAHRVAGLDFLGEATKSNDKEIRRAAFRAMQEWPDPDEVLDFLIVTAGKDPGSVNGVLALRAYTKQLERLAEKRAASISKGRKTDSFTYVDGGNINLTANHGGGEVTVSMWVCPSALSGDDRLFGQLSGAMTQQGAMRVAGDGRLEVWNVAAWLQVAPAGTLTTGARTHLAFVWTGNSVQAFVNGVAQSTGTANFDFGATNGHFGIGAPFLGRYGKTLAGSIDHVAVYSVALTSGQIKTLADGSTVTAAVPVKIPTPAHRWRFDDNGRTTATLTDQAAQKEMVRRYRKGLDLAVTRPEKSGLLSGLSRVGHVEALNLAIDRFEDPEVKEDAMLAAYKISAVLNETGDPEVKPALEKIIEGTANASLEKNARNLLNLNAPENAVILFDGKNTSAWMQHRGMRIPTDDEIKKASPCHYKLVDGALEVTDPGHLVTRQHFNDFRFHVEVWLPGEDGINSGIWTHFRYGIEIRGLGEKRDLYRLGAIYGLKAPDADASKPAGTWQILDVTFRNARFDDAGKKAENARMTVLLNGVKIHDEAEIKRRCPTLVEPEGPAPGPIVLENHSGKGRVRFRNIWVVPM